MTTKSLKFEEALQQLEGLVSKLERGDMPLDEAMHAFENGVELVKFCQKKLTEAEAKVEKILAEGETVKTASFEG